jgi:hypothetical protein
MIHGPKPDGDSLLCPNFNEDLVALTIMRGASQATHTWVE